MAINLRLVQKLQTRLALTPQLKTSIDILQLPLIELAARIEQELAENPVLEELDSPQEAESDVEDGPEADVDEGDGEPERNLDDLNSPLSNLKEEWQEGFQSPLNVRPEDLQERLNYLESLITKPPTLAEHLLKQYSLLDTTDRERDIAETIIGNIDENGYLKASLEEIASASQSTPEEAGRVLRRIQTLEPPGVASRTLTECLLIQLKKHPDSSRRKNAQRILSEQIAALEKRQYAKIARALALTPTEVNDACRFISKLEPKPGRRFSSERAVTVIPDLVAQEKDGEMVLTTRDDGLPRLRINARYRKMLKDPKIDKPTKDFIRQKIQLATGFIRAVDQRHGTLKRIAEELVATQRLFLEKGVEHLKPLRLKDIARATGLHESTISRTVQNKYMETAGGIIPLRSFFSGAIHSQDGEAKSQASIKDRIRRLINEESPKKPLSDARITELLRKDRLEIARRTVAKYREEMKILPTHQRRERP